MTKDLGPNTVYSSQNIMSDSVAGKNRHFFTKVKKTKVPLSVKLKSLFRRKSPSEKSPEFADSNSPKKPKSNKKLIIILIAAGVVIILAIVILILVIVNNKPNTELSPEDAEPESSSVEDNENETATPEKVEDNRLAYEEKLEKAETDKDKAEIRSDRAMYFWDLMAGHEGYDDYTDLILEDLKFAESVEQSSETAYDLCMFLTNRESLNPENIDYCKIAKDRNPDAFTEPEDDEWV